VVCSLLYQTESEFLSLIKFLVTGNCCAHYVYNVYYMKMCSKYANLSLTKSSQGRNYYPENSYSVLQSYIYSLKASKFLIFGGHADLGSQVLELRNANTEDAFGVLMLPLLHECAFDA